MKDKKNLRFFLMKRFLFLLILVGIAEGILNLLFHGVVYPWIEQVFGLSHYLEDVTLSGTVALVLQGFFYLCLEKAALVLPEGAAQFVEAHLSKRMEDGLFEQFARHSAGLSVWEQRVYAAGLICVIFLIVLFWLLPYVLAAVSFGVTVSAKVAELTEEQRRQQEAYERQRNLLLSDVAHDLKTPMTTVAGYAQALAEGEVKNPDTQQEYLDAIKRKSMQMNELIGLLFEYVKLDSEGFSLKKEETDLAELLREVVASLYTDFEEKGMELSLSIPEEPGLLLLDPVQFSRAIRNLLTNAIKHNPSGTTVGVNMQDKSRELVVEVWDNGVTIPAETAAHLFEPFVQGDASRRSANGSGLGLSITQKIVAMHGGSIRLKQEEARKAFVIKLPKPKEEY